MSDIIRNKVAESGIVTINPESFLPKEEIVLFDIKDFLFREMILKEKDFREALKNHTWENYQNKNVGIICSADAIIPLWAYMLITTYLQPIANFVVVGDKAEVEKILLLQKIKELNPADYTDARVVIKGCGDLPVGDFAYAEITRILLPVVKSLMFGEPCSTVPVYKKKTM
ncbi:MAG: DUF2480 family protein [Niabella sp.]